MTTIDEWDDRKMTAEQKSMVDQLSEADIKEIERNLLENASDEWCKVGRIVLTTMIEREEGVTGLPESFFAHRIAKLVKEGLLESRGDASNIKLTEVRLTQKKKD